MTPDPPFIPPELALRLREVRHVVVLTGAGISAESGIPTFREAQTGLWAQYDPQELATPAAFRRNPRLVWEWYAWRRELVAGAKPNPGHYALAEIEKRVPRFTLITQNIDGLHQKAGVQQPIELHGNLATVKCLTEDRIVDRWENTDDPPPRCPNCGGLLRPNVVWFGEAMPVDAFNRALQAARSADLFLTIGTSSIVYPAAELPFEAIERGAIAVEINPNETSLSGSMAYVLKGPSGIILPALVDQAWPPTERPGDEDYTV
jgi:NAD-dependent deacetylase